MDMQKIPPVHQKRIVTFVNNFIIDTVSFLNKFINSSQNSLWQLEKRMRKLETTLKLLEVKLSFIPDSKETCEVSEKILINESINSVSISDNNFEELKNVNEEKNVDTESKCNIPPEIQKYVKMVKVGVPIAAVKLKMQNENLDPNLLNVE